MKVITRAVMNMKTGEWTEEESFEYSGPVAQAMPSLGGGGPAGGDDPSGGATGGGKGGVGDAGGYGGFGGLGIGNPGSYGGQQSVGAPGFAGGYGGVETGPEFGKSEAGKSLKNRDKILTNDFADTPTKIKDQYRSKTAALAADIVGSLGLVGKIAEKAIDKINNDLAAKAYAKDKLVSDYGYAPDLVDAFRDASGTSGPAGAAGQTESPGAEKPQAAPTTQPAGMPAAPGMPTGDLSSQYYGMFVGPEARYNIPDMMQHYTRNVQREIADYDARIKSYRDDWKEFNDYYKSRGEQLTSDFGQLQQKYSKQLGNIPQATLTLPGGMGGGGLPLAPKNWTATLGAQAGIESDLLRSQANLMPTMANIQGTALSNVGNLENTGFQNRLYGLGQGMKPYDVALGLLMADKGQQNALAQIEAQKPPEPKWYQAALPAAAAVFESGALEGSGDLLKGLFTSDSGTSGTSTTSPAGTYYEQEVDW